MIFAYIFFHLHAKSSTQSMWRRCKTCKYLSFTTAQFENPQLPWCVINAISHLINNSTASIYVPNSRIHLRFKVLFYRYFTCDTFFPLFSFAWKVWRYVPTIQSVYTRFSSLYFRHILFVITNLLLFQIEKVRIDSNDVAESKNCV